MWKEKKGDKQELKKLQSCVTSDNLLDLLIDGNLISSNQSEHKARYSCINQLLPITHEIYQSFDDSLEERSVFLDISKDFGKVWRAGVSFIIRQNVALNGQWISVKTGASQVSVLNHCS